MEVVGTSSEFSVDTFGKPKNVIIDPNNQVLRYSPEMRVAVAIRRGEQFAEMSEFTEALKRVPQGARDQPQQLAGALPDGRGLLPAETTSSRPPTSSAKC